MRLEGRLRRGGRGLLGRGVSDVFAHDLVGVAGGAEGSTATGDSTIVSCAGVATAAGPGFALGLPSALDGSHHAARRNTAIRSEDRQPEALRFMNGASTSRNKISPTRTLPAIEAASSATKACL